MIFLIIWVSLPLGATGVMSWPADSVVHCEELAAEYVPIIEDLETFHVTKWACKEQKK